jgi:hypothetical protein
MTQGSTFCHLKWPCHKICYLFFCHQKNRPKAFYIWALINFKVQRCLNSKRYSSLWIVDNLLLWAWYKSGLKVHWGNLRRKDTMSSSQNYTKKSVLRTVWPVTRDEKVVTYGSNWRLSCTSLVTFYQDRQHGAFPSRMILLFLICRPDVKFSHDGRPCLVIVMVTTNNMAR